MLGVAESATPIKLSIELNISRSVPFHDSSIMLKSGGVEVLVWELSVNPLGSHRKIPPFFFGMVEPFPSMRVSTEHEKKVKLRVAEEDITLTSTTRRT